jgi:hypothetical protein
MPFVLLVLGLIGGGMLALLALNTASAANEVQRHNIAESDQSVAAQVEQLQIDARNSAAPGNLARAAAALGMVPAGNPGFIEIGRSGVERVLGRPAPATAAPVYVPPPPPTTHHDTVPGGHDQPNGRPDPGHRAGTPGQHGTNQHRTNRHGTNRNDTNRHDRNGHRHGGDAHGAPQPGRGAGHRASDHTTPPPSPTATPTPTITLPGGGR